MLPQDLIDRIRTRCDRFDHLPVEWRKLVWEWGWGPVWDCYQMGLSCKQAAHLIARIKEGTGQVNERLRADGRTSPAGDRVAEAMNDIGMVEGSPHGLAAAIARRGGVILPRRPLEYMVLASRYALPRRQPMAWVDDNRKHQLRLTDALEAAAQVEHAPREATDYGLPPED